MEGCAPPKEGQHRVVVPDHEIPGEVYGEPQILADELKLSRVHQEVRSLASSNNAYPYHSPGVAMRGDNMAFYGSLNSVNSFVRELRTGKDNSEDDGRPANGEVDLPDDQSLTFVLENLNIDNNNSKEHTTQSSPQCHRDSHACGLPFYGQQNPLASMFSSLDLTDRSVLHNRIQALQVYSHQMVNGMGRLNFQLGCQENETTKVGAIELREQKVELPGYLRDTWRAAPIQIGDGSFTMGPSNFQFVSGVPLLGMDPQPSTFQQPFSLDKSPTWMQSHCYHNHDIACDDRYVMMDGKHFYLEQLQNQSVHHLQTGAPHHAHQGTNDAFECGRYQQGNTLMDSCSCGKENSAFAYGRRQLNESNIFERRIFSDKFRTRSKGSKFLRMSETNLLTSNERVNHPNYKQKLLADNQLYLLAQSSISFPSNNCTRLISRSSPAKYEYGSLDDVIGRIYSLSKDQTGCRFLQGLLKNCTFQDLHKIFGEITGHIVELATNTFGNYLLQKLVDSCDERLKTWIIQEIANNHAELIRISCDVHGTRVVQKLIENIERTEHMSMVASSLKPGMMLLTKDMNGNHVVQYCLQYLSPELSKFLLEDVILHSIELAKDRQGCIVIQKCLAHLHGEQREQLMFGISSDALALSRHEFGNYVVQCLIELRVPSLMGDVLDKLEGNFADLSVQKYSSNVVEKCLKYFQEDQCILIVRELITHPKLVQIVQDPFGNFVIQTAIRSCKGAIYHDLAGAIRPHIPTIQSNPFGKKVLSTLNRKKRSFC